MDNQLNGWWISLSEEEERNLHDLLVSAGYESTPAGLKKMLFEDGIENEEAEKPVSVADMVTGWVRANPDKVLRGVNMVKNVFGKK